VYIVFFHFVLCSKALVHIFGENNKPDVNFARTAYLM